MEHNLLKIQKNLYNYMKKKAHSYETHVSANLKRYSLNQIKSSRRAFKVSNTKALEKMIKHSNIIYLGDFHTFDQNSKNVIRIIETLIEENTNLFLGVEFVTIDKQYAIDNYLNNNISEIEFLEEINYRESWKFPWCHYKIFFNIAKENNYKIIALNTEGDLTSRDLKAAEIIVNTITENEKSKMLILFGELHIVKNKLPKHVSKLIKKKKINQSINDLIIHQNLDAVYWKMVQNKIKSRIIRFNKNEFSLQSSPPWIKYESLIYWYENMLDDPDFDIHDYCIDNNIKNLNNNIHDNFIFICKKIMKSLHITIPDSDLEDFNLYGHKKLNFIIKKLDDMPKKHITSFYKYLVENGKTFKIPFSNRYYCSNYSINKLSFLAGNHIYHILSLKQEQSYEAVLLHGTQVNKFLFFLWQCKISFFGSKIINPYHKCDHYLNMKEKVKKYTNLSTTKKNNIQLAIDILERKKNLQTLLKGKTLRNLYFSAKYVGNFIADVYFDDYFVKRRDSNLLTTTIIENDRNAKKFKFILDTIIPKATLKTKKKKIF